MPEVLSEVSLFWAGQKSMLPSTAQPWHHHSSLSPSWHCARPRRISPCACTAQPLAMEPGPIALQTALELGMLICLPLLQCSTLQIPDASAVQNSCFLPAQLGDTITLLGIHFFALQQGVPWQNLSKYGDHRICFPSPKDYSFVWLLFST